MTWQHISEPTDRIMSRLMGIDPEPACEWFRYVTLENVGEYLAKGWEIADDMANCHHGNYAVLMRFAGEGEPK